MPRLVRAADLDNRPGASGIPYRDAITALHGAKAVYAAVVTVPPGARSVPHYHVNTETIIYQLRGRVVTYFGPDLAEAVETGPGDFLYIAPGEIHQAVNDSGEPAEGIVFRNTEVEEVVEVRVAARRDGAA